jgi:hypothetical protein
MISDFKEDSNKQKNEIRKSIQEVDKKVRNTEGTKFSKEMEIKKNNQHEMLEMQTSRNQMLTTVNSIISRQAQTEERI